MVKRKHILKAGISAAAAVLAINPAFAQQTSPADADEGAVVVTGSRIARPQVDAQVPVAVMDAAAIRQDGSASIEDILRKMPQIGIGASRSNSNFATSGNGAATVNLRNLGPSRTLVLVNGRRFVAGFPGSSAVDLNNIPTDFIERVEVVTGGTSAVYGSDAIAGVVNFILKNDIQGISARADYGITSRGDNAKYLFSLTGGMSFGADDRGHVSANFTYDKDAGLLSRNREISREDRSLALVGVPAYSSYVPQGRFDLRTATGSAQVFTFNPDNSLVLGFPQSLAYNRNGDRRISLPVERYLASANLRYDIADGAELFVEPMYSRVTSSARLEAAAGDWSFVYSNGGPGIPITNPYIPAGIRSIITTRNADADATNDVVAIQFRRRQNEVFDRSNNARRETWRVATGVRGDVGALKYDVSYVFGQMKDSTTAEDVNSTRYREALDSMVDGTGAIVCRSAAARAEGCVPINIFGFNTVTAKAADYVLIPRYAHIKNTQHVASATVSGKAFRLPAGSVDFALGAEYRNEKSATDWDENTNAGNLAGFARQQDLTGRFNVYELFGETSVPILADKPLFHQLGLTAAARYSRYSSIGSVFSWNAGINYAPFAGLRLRGNYAEANRAPSVTELYSLIVGGGGGGATVIDPCAGATLTSTRPQDAGCRAIPGLVGEIAANGGVFTYSSFDLNWMGIAEGGNPNLKQETAKTLTLGGVLTPRGLRGFSLSVDYFDIRIDNAIGSLPAQIMVDRCQSSGEAMYCGGIQRFPTGKLNTIATYLVNVANIQTRGIDVNLSYNRPLGLAQDDNIAFDLFYTRLLSLEKQSYSGGPIEENLGQLFAAGRLGTGFKNKASARLSYSVGGFAASWQVNYLSSIQDRLGWQAPAGPDQAYLQSLNNVGSVFYHNIQLRQSIDASRKYEFVLGVDNLFDRQPPLIPAGFASSLAGVETAQEYDPYGRRFYAGVRFSF